ncbi:MAG: hypothetical protein QGI45_16110, partial [Myxococcota bacterium]|nr:hypothetical protein [Myxococcota bacterium]
SYVTLRGAGEHQSHLYFPRSEGMSEWSRQAHILFEPVGTWGHGASSDAALILDAQVFDTSVIVDTLGALALGQDIVLGAEISAAFRADFNITSEWSSANGQWMPFFHRKITSIQSVSRGYRIEFDVPLRYALKTRDNASVRIQSNLLNKVGIESLAVSNAVSRDAAWKVDPEVAMSSTSLMAHVHLLEMNGVKNSFMHKIKSFEPSTFGFSYQSGKHLQSGGLDIANSKNVTVAEVTMKNAQNRGPDGNGYLFKVARSNEILVRDSVGQSGRHNFAVNNHFGTSGCVFLRIYSSDANKYQWFAGGPVWTSPGNSDFHKALSAANLVDSSTLHDGWSAKYYVNGFPHYNPNAGHTSFQNVFWNNGGSGTVVSHQFHYGYNIGARGSLRTDLNGQSQTSPQDFFEGGRNLMVGQDMDRNIGEKLFPSSLYEHQLVRRKGGYPGVSPVVAGPQSTGCPWGMDLEGFYLNGTPICKSVLATAVRICKCVKEDAFIYGSQCLYNENGHYRARELKSGSCSDCPFGMSKIGEYQGRNVCKPLITTP